MVRVETRVLIERPIDDVFEFLTNVDNIPLWDSKVIRAELTPGTMKKGAVIHESRRVWWGTIDATHRVIEYQPSTKFCLEGEAGGIKATSCLGLTGTGNETDLAFVGEYEGGTLFRLLRHVSRGFVKRNVTATMRTIKQLLEERDST